MYYLDENLNIIKITEKEVINKFSERAVSPNGIVHQFYYENGVIWRWSPSGSNKYLIDVTEEEGHKFLLDRAVEHAVHVHGYCIVPHKKVVLALLHHIYHSYVEEQNLSEEEKAEVRNKITNIIANNF